MFGSLLLKCWLKYLFAYTFLFFFIANVLHAQQNSTDCQQAPEEIFRQICLQLQTWDESARLHTKRQQQDEGNSIFADFRRFGQPNPINSAAISARFHTDPQSCFNLQCLCPHIRGMIGPEGLCYLSSGQPLRKALRREYRTLTDQERQRYHQVLNQLKSNGEFDRFNNQHRQVGVSSGAHSGPGFLPFHREFTKRFEIAVRLLDPSLAIPYWDSTLDSYLPNPADSVIFSALFTGESDAYGNVVNGPFAGWRTLEGRANIVRSLGKNGQLFRKSDIDAVLAQTQIEQILAFTVPQQGCPWQTQFGALEYRHNQVHWFVGGDMRLPSTAANDPLVYGHHAFVDWIWETWRQSHQNRWNREQAYPIDLISCANSQHFVNSIMRPFDITNKMGLSNAYTDNLYDYAPRPTCSYQNPSCGSAYLFCDTRGSPHCVSKVKPNGMCQGFEGFDVCSNGVCFNGVCVPGATHATQPPSRIVSAQQNFPFSNQAQRAQQMRASQAFQNAVFQRPFQPQVWFNQQPEWIPQPGFNRFFNPETTDLFFSQGGFSRRKKLV